MPVLASLVLLAAVEVSAEGPCLDANAVAAALETTLAVAQGDRIANLEVHVTAIAATAPGFTGVTLAASAGGDEVLRRSFTLSDPDCPQGADLLEAMLARFLDGFPREKWTEAAPAPVATPRPPRWKRIGVAVRGAGDLGMLPSSEDPLVADTSGDFEVAIAPDRGGPSIELLLRQGTWSDVGRGRYQPVSFLAGAGWAWKTEKSFSHAGIHTGVLAIRDDKNAEPVREKLLPWVEVYAGIAWAAGPVRIGPQVAGSLIRVNAETASGSARRAIPTNRIGLRLEIPL